MAKDKIPTTPEPGKEWWRNAITVGRPAKIKTPKELREKLIAYCEFTDKRVINNTDFRGKDAKRVDIPKAVPYTMAGFCIFLGVNTKYFNDFEKNLDLTKAKDQEFSELIFLIKDIFFTQKFEGSACGLWNANLISQELGMKSKIENTIIHEQPLFGEDGDDGIID